MYDVTEWKHVFKLDPNKDLPDEQLEILCESGTDAVIIGGSDGVTEDNVLRMLSQVRRFLVPCVLEVSAIEAIVPGFDLYFIPSVLNSKNPDWIVGMHQKAMKEYGELMSMEEIVAEGYCIVNPDCKAAALTEADTNLNHDDIIAYARVSELLRLPIFYLEYSGALGDIEAVKKTKAVLETSTLFYGGGIKDAETALQYAEHADVIVVGNAVYENFDEALKTVAAVKGE
ncbi:heptaprenylglyceryl phosphate synthase [Bacillus halotolerans]|uniref:Heptaprenylglyceryl phosphate synthase n=1 Tax=Bacillus halotolerans TaxID=260554 RepID=A0ABY7I283_9BACI|nr:heptaprenylglyceryl phosphate synthase [Bacillus halotolerans]MBV5124239.1 heptaprenylglyceryl phosphate synthase [Bacillus halotolerans]MCC2117765.1 heptaprenylglyceryl phosphate synthase [Bacillus halotolerans]MDG0767971.1 heptaprenylglyceryl phosphate synthase [Bacillus halotolerans]MDG3075715.1 heptaprenylglyceryl phosphate synthase [Bacillus halotolerans]MEC0251929.1 heptaprenylglyceryl phosphate synthase [Bacillus halotolerans]